VLIITETLASEEEVML